MWLETHSRNYHRSEVHTTQSNRQVPGDASKLSTAFLTESFFSPQVRGEPQKTLTSKGNLSPGGRAGGARSLLPTMSQSYASIVVWHWHRQTDTQTTDQEPESSD